jgi:hypothetical protein
MAGIVGIDIGRGLVKAIYSGRKVSFPSVVGRTVNRRYGTLMGGMESNGRLQARIINRHGEKTRLDRLVGQEAIEQTLSAHSDLTRLRRHEDVLALVGEALYKLGVTGPINLVAGAPVDYYQDVKNKRYLSVEHKYDGEGKVTINAWTHIEVSDEPVPHTRPLEKLSAFSEGRRARMCGQIVDFQSSPEWTKFTIADDWDSIEVRVTGPNKIALPVGRWLCADGKVARTGRYLDLFRGHWTVNRTEIEVEDVRVIPEGVGVVFSLALNTNGKVRDESILRQTVAVIDVGMYTTDCVVVRKMNFQEPLSFSVPQGVGVLLRGIHNYLLNGYSMDVPEFKLFNALRDRYISIGGNRVGLDEPIQMAYEALTDTIMAQVRARWENEPLDRVFLAGGGSYHIGKHIHDAMGYGEQLQDAEWHNALGFHAYAARTWR